MSALASLSDLTPAQCISKIWTCNQISYLLCRCGTKQTSCVCNSSSFVCLHTHAHTHKVTRIQCDPHVDRSKSKAALPSINRLIHGKSYTLAQLYVCVSWPVFNFDQTVPGSVLLMRLKGTNETLALLVPVEYDCFCWLRVQGVGRGYHIMRALELVGRFIVGSTVDDVHTVWSFVWMGSDVLNGFTIVCPLFIVRFMVFFSLDECV